MPLYNLRRYTDAETRGLRGLFTQQSTALAEAGRVEAMDRMHRAVTFSLLSAGRNLGAHEASYVNVIRRVPTAALAAKADVVELAGIIKASGGAAAAASFNKNAADIRLNATMLPSLVDTYRGLPEQGQARFMADTFHGVAAVKGSFAATLLGNTRAAVLDTHATQGLGQAPRFYERKPGPKLWGDYAAAEARIEAVTGQPAAIGHYAAWGEGVAGIPVTEQADRLHPVFYLSQVGSLPKSTTELSALLGSSRNPTAANLPRRVL